MAGASRLSYPLRSPATSTAFHRLVPFNWAGEIVVTAIGMLASFLVAGLWWPYWRIADMDFWVVYNAFLLNTPLPQEFFDHPGYLTILSLAEWLRALHGLGIVKVISLSSMPPVANRPAFDHAWMAATQAGRVLSLILAMSFVTAFAYLLRALIRDWHVAAVATFLLAFSGGMAMEMRVLRTELLAAAFFTCALLLLLFAAKNGEQTWRPAIVGAASLLLTLAMLNKVQAWFLIIALPLLVIPFGPEAAVRQNFWRDGRRAVPALVVIIILALTTSYFAKDIIIAGLTSTGTPELQLPTLSIGTQIYWPLIAAWIAFGMIVYAIAWRVAALEVLASFFAGVAGCMIGLLALYLRYHPDDVVVVFHPLEQMFRWAAGATPELREDAPGLTAQRLRFLVDSILGVIARRTFFLSPSPRPTIFLEWFVIAATVIAARRREWRIVSQVSVLMFTVWGIDTLGMGRGLKQEYFIFTDPMVIIAAALIVTKLADLQTHRWTYPVGIALVATHIVLSQAEPVKHIFKSDGPEKLCDLYGYAKRVEHFPFCPSQ